MKWINVEEKLPLDQKYIIAIAGCRLEQNGDFLEDAVIVILRNMGFGLQWRTMDCAEIYYLPEDNQDYYETIQYWMPWDQFIFPESMIKKEES